MPYDPDLHHRRTIRLRDFDYSQSSAYHITICTQDGLHLFGFMKGDMVQLNPAGKMIQEWFNKLPDKFESLYCDEFMIMPNHFHFIIFLNTQFVGTDPCVCPEYYGKKEEDKHMGLSLPGVIQWFKTMTTNEYIRGVKEDKWMPFNKKVWQHNYYEHIIRNEMELCRIREFISNNPSRWFTRNEI
jgi:putative transposase